MRAHRELPVAAPKAAVEAPFGSRPGRAGVPLSIERASAERRTERRRLATPSQSSSTTGLRRPFQCRTAWGRGAKVRPMAPERAVNRAFWTVKLPSLALIFTPLVCFTIFGKLQWIPTNGIAGFRWFLAAFLSGFGAGWFVWSVQVPRWRRWAYEQVDDIEALKLAATEAGILWPQGHPLERTELASRRLRMRIRQLESEKISGKPGASGS
jgi:hypothetical protein